MVDVILYIDVEDAVRFKVNSTRYKALVKQNKAAVGQWAGMWAGFSAEDSEEEGL